MGGLQARMREAGGIRAGSHRGKNVLIAGDQVQMAFRGKLSARFFLRNSLTSWEGIHIIANKVKQCMSSAGWIS
jgi:hypothetical protein